MNLMNEKKSFGFKTRVTLILFSIFILLILYFFQNLYLNYYYEIYKIDQVESIAKTIKIKKKDLNSYFSQVSYENDICIEVITNVGNVLYNENLKGCILKNPNNKTKLLMEKMYLSNKEKEFYKITNPLFDTKSFLFGMRVENGYIFINSQLESLDETNLVLRRQLIYLVIIVIIVSIIISYFVSHSITKPILKITEKAKKLSNGDLNVTFEGSTISEIDELSRTLNLAKNEMIKTDDYRRDLMANVGHDLKTPLTLIKSYAEMVRDLSYKDEMKRTEHLNIIIKESDRLNDLVNDIIVLSKLEANAECLEIETYDIVYEIKEIISKFNILELTENYDFIYTGPNSAMIKADKKKINQVIYNLVGNAINYTGEDLKVFINIKENRHNYQIEIIDTGKGIDSDKIKHVWDRYYKTDKQHKRNKVGTGLGLSIVKEILDNHHFKYGVESTKDSGTKFYFMVKKND